MNLHAQTARVPASDAVLVGSERASARKPVSVQSNLIKENFYTEAELATVLHRCIRTLRLWHRARVGPPRIRPAGFREVLYSKESVLNWLKQSEQKSVREPRTRRAR